MYQHNVSSFRKFFSAPYQFNPMNGDNIHLKKLEEYHPELKRGFNNIFELRKYKYLNYLKLFDLLSNVIFVNYESINKDPQGFLNLLADTYGITKKQEFIPCTTYKGKYKVPFKQKNYFPIIASDLNLMNQLIDWDVENLLGYIKRESEAF